MADYAKLCRKNQQSNKSDTNSSDLDHWQQSALPDCSDSFSYAEIPGQRQGPDPLSMKLGKERTMEIQNKAEGAFDAPMRASEKCKATEDLNRDSKRALLSNTDSPGLISGLDVNDFEKSRRRMSRNLNASSPSSPNDNSVSRSSPSGDTSDTDFELIEATGNDLGSAEAGTDEFFQGGEERLIDPDNYFKRLEAIEEKVALNSALRNWSREHQRSPKPFTNNLSESIGALLSKLPSDQYVADHHPILMECRNDIARVLYNAVTMRDTGYSNGSFNLLVLDLERSNVVQLIPFDLTDVMQMVEAFEQAYKNIALSILLRPTNIELYTHTLTMECIVLFKKLGLGQTKAAEKLSNLNIWRSAVHILDFALLSYAGAHLEAFDEKYLGTRWETFEIASLSSFVVLRRRRLQCLDDFLGQRDVWVFHPYSLAPTSDESSRLLLSTRIETMADVWGPMWKTVKEHDTNIVEYSIGNGMIVPWCQDRSIGNATFPLLESNERYCHWISARKYIAEDVKSHQHGISSTFDGTETLVIGAAETSNNCSDSIYRSTYKELGLQVNKACKLSCEDLLHIKNSMKNKGALKEPMTKSSRRYKDSHAIQVQGSAMGFVSVADTITYKRRAGLSMKDTLVERWRNGPRKFSELASCSGVEVSLCTQNARRRRLLDILGTGTIRKYLDSISFSWPSEKFELEYFDSLGEPKSFR